VVEQRLVTWVMLVWSAVGIGVTVAGYLGGGTEGAGLAALLFIAVIVAYLVIFRWAVPRSGRLQSWVRAPFDTDVETVQETEAEPTETNITSLLTTGERYVSARGPYKVTNGRPKRIKLNIERGYWVVGTLEERDRQDFDFMIANEDDWVRFQQDKHVKPLCEGRDSTRVQSGLPGPFVRWPVVPCAVDIRQAQ